MKVFSSAFLWLVGGLNFFLIFLILFPCFLIFQPKKLYPFVRILARIQLFVMGVRLKVHGLNNFDHKKTYLIMGNHQSLFDLFALPAAIPMCFVGIEAAYHFSIPLWGRLTKRWGNIPMHRKDKVRAIKSLKKADDVIKHGQSIVILPEGHRTRTGEIGEFKKGPFHLAKAAKADILPLVMIGFFEYNKKNDWHLNPGEAHVIFGESIRFESFKDLSIDELKSLVQKKMKGLMTEF